MEIPCSWPLHIRSSIANELRLTHLTRSQTLLRRPSGGSYAPVKTKLFESFCLSLYGSALWFSSSPELRSLEVTFNNILRRIWSLPQMCHTGILHCTAKLNSVYNIVVLRSSKLLSAALKSHSSLLQDIFVHSSTLTSTSIARV